MIEGHLTSSDLAAATDRIPFAKLLGVEATFLAKDRIEARMPVRPEHCNPMGGLHGGACISVADTLGAMGAFPKLPEGAAGAATLESKTNFIGPARAGETVPAAGTSGALVTQIQMTL
jgi:uncharacterized protein (TIGR00369 family)